MIWGRMIGNYLIGPFCLPKELKLSSNTYCSFLKILMEPLACNLFLAQLTKIIFLRDHLHASFLSVNKTVFMSAAVHFLDYYLHGPLCLRVRIGIVIILLIRDIIPIVRLLRLFRLLLQATLLHYYNTLTISLNHHHQTEVSSLKDFPKILALSLISAITQQFILLTIDSFFYLAYFFYNKDFPAFHKIFSTFHIT